MYWFDRLAQRIVETTQGRRIKRPPMVGVPAFSTMWRCGPSARIGWPLPCFTLSHWIHEQLTKNARRKAVMTAPHDRKVRYLNNRKNSNWSVWVSRERFFFFKQKTAY